MIVTVYSAIGRYACSFCPTKS